MPILIGLAELPIEPLTADSTMLRLTMPLPLPPTMLPLLLVTVVVPSGLEIAPASTMSAPVVPVITMLVAVTVEL